MVVVLFVDLQKVLLAPAFNASAFYYKTKLCSYNYTIYDKKHMMPYAISGMKLQVT